MTTFRECYAAKQLIYILYLYLAPILHIHACFINQLDFSSMIKKIIALAATAFVSFSASADYVRYDFGGPMSGYFIQHDDDGSIADFKIDLPITGAPRDNPRDFKLGFFPARSEGSTLIAGATTYFRNNGPTNFSIRSNFGADQDTFFTVDFSRATQGNFAYNTTYSSSIFFNGGNQFFSGTHTGLLSQGTVTSSVAANLDFLGGYIEQINVVIPTFINPNQVPEPGSLALLAVGALGALGAARRRKQLGI